MTKLTKELTDHEEQLYKEKIVSQKRFVRYIGQQNKELSDRTGIAWQSKIENRYLFQPSGESFSVNTIYRVSAESLKF